MTASPEQQEAQSVNDSHDPFDLTDVSIIITGGTRGLGLQLALGLAGRGARVATCGRSPSDVERLHGLVDPQSSRIFAVECDVADEHAVNDFIARAEHIHGPVQCLINNAAVDRVGNLLDLDAASWYRTFATNVMGPVVCTNAVVRHMIAKGVFGSIINISSVASMVGVPRLGPYSASKAALNQLTRTMAVEWAEYGICVNTIVLGSMNNVMTGNEDTYPDDSWQLEVGKSIPLGRVGRAGDLLTAIVYIASRASSHVTGSALILDGGYLGTRTSV